MDSRPPTQRAFSGTNLVAAGALTGASAIAAACPPAWDSWRRLFEQRASLPVRPPRASQPLRPSSAPPTLGDQAALPLAAFAGAGAAAAALAFRRPAQRFLCAAAMRRRAAGLTDRRSVV